VYIRVSKVCSYLSIWSHIYLWCWLLWYYAIRRKYFSSV